MKLQILGSHLFETQCEEISLLRQETVLGDLQLLKAEQPKKGILDRYKRNVIYQFQSLNGQDKPVRQYGRQTGITKNLATFLQKKFL